MRRFRTLPVWALTTFFLFSVASPFGFAARSPLQSSGIYPLTQINDVSLDPKIESSLERILRDRLAGIRGDQGRFRLLGPDYYQKLARHFHQLCVQNRVDPAFVLSLIQAESGFKARARSVKGAVGLMQIMPDTARFVARRNGLEGRITPQVLEDPFINLTLGITYLRELQDRYTGFSAYHAVAAYNMGPGKFDQMRSRPGFTPVRTWKYYRDIMRGLKTWRRYGLTSELKEAAIKPGSLKVKAHEVSILPTEWKRPNVQTRDLFLHRESA